MGRPPRNKHQISTPERLLNAAELEFANAGFAKARLADIARLAGIRRPSLLYHYPSKDELYKATVQRCFNKLASLLLDAIKQSQNFKQGLRRLTLDFHSFLQEKPHIARLVIREFLEGQGPGRDILMSQVAPLLDSVEAFINNQGRDQIQNGLPLRPALMRVISDLLLQTASGDLKEPLWGPQDHAWSLTQTTFFGPHQRESQ